MKNRDKLAQALNNIWIGHCRIWGWKARFDRFAQYDSDSSNQGVKGYGEEEKVRPVVRRWGEGEKIQSEGKKGEDEGVGGVKMVRVGNKEVLVERKGRKRR